MLWRGKTNDGCRTDFLRAAESVASQDIEREKANAKIRPMEEAIARKSENLVSVNVNYERLARLSIVPIGRGRNQSVAEIFVQEYLAL